MYKVLQRVIRAAFFMLLCNVVGVKAQTYVQQGPKLVGSGGLGNGQKQGNAVAISADGNTAVIGAPGDDNNRGAAYIYHRTGTTWTQTAKLIGSVDYPTENFPEQGTAVDVSADGNTVIIGGYKNFIYSSGLLKSFAGAAWVFVNNGGSWVEQAKISGTSGTGFLGVSVSLSGNGNVALVGCGLNITNLFTSAYAQVWERGGVNWTRKADITISTPSSSTSDPSRVGASAVALSADGNTAVIGISDDGAGGGAWIYTRNGNSWVQQGAKLTGTGGSLFGYAVALSADGNNAFIVEKNTDFAWAYQRTGNSWAAIDRLRPFDEVTNPAASSVSCNADATIVIVGGPEGDPRGAGWVFARRGNNWQQINPKLAGIGNAGVSHQGVAVALSSSGKTALVGGNTDASNMGATWVFDQAPPPVITTGPVTGTISACLHSASVSPNIQQFTVMGIDLTADITVSAPTGFDISLDANSGYNTGLIIPQSSPGSAAATIYVRAASTAAAGAISGDVTLASTGASPKTVPVSGTVYALATVNQIPSATYTSGQNVAAINFTGTADTYSWTCDNPSIGIVSNSGINTIPSFIAANSGTANVTAHFKVTPVNSNGCNGTDMLFDIVVKPAGFAVSLTGLTGVIKACQGVPSASPDIQQFTISGSNFSAGDDIIIQPTSTNIEISAQAGTGYNTRIRLMPINGEVTTKTIYVRSTVTAPGGPLSGGIRITSGIKFDKTLSVNGNIAVQGNINAITPQVYDANTPHDIVFQGTATNVKWTNDNPAIGLGSDGSGNIHFTALNSGATDIEAHLLAIPNNSSGCNGNSVTFTIKVKAVTAATPVIHTTGGLPLLSTKYGTPSTAGSFTVSGDDMQAGITVTPPPGYEVSTDDITFGKTVVVGKAGSILLTPVYIRLAKNTPVGIYPGNVTLSSTGAADVKQPVNGSDAVSPATLTITADNQTKITGTPNPPLTVTYKGFVNNESAAVLTIPPVITTTAALNSAPGFYPITVSGAAAPNYTITYAGATMLVKPQPVDIVVSNAFTPNGDGINDTWLIKNIDGFPKSVVQVFNRYGSSVYYSVGYAIPWTGQLKGTDLPVGTYYYIIDLKNGEKLASGWVAIIR